MSGTLLDMLRRFAPVARTAPAQDSLAVFRQVDDLPDRDSFGGSFVAPSLGIRSLGLPEDRMPDFGGLTLYFDPEVLRASRMYSADTWTPRSEAILNELDARMPEQWLPSTQNPGDTYLHMDPASSAPLDQTRPLLSRYFGETPIRNGEAPVSPDSDRVLAGLAQQFPSVEDATQWWRRNLVQGQPSQRPFQDYPNFHDELAHRWATEVHSTDPLYNLNLRSAVAGPNNAARRLTSQRLHDALDSPVSAEGRLSRDRLDAPERTIEQFQAGLPPELRGRAYDYLNLGRDQPVTYGEAKLEDFLSPENIVAATSRVGVHPITGDPYRERLRQMLGRDVPFATELQGLDPAVLRRLTFGTMPLALGLEGEE